MLQSLFSKSAHALLSPSSHSLLSWVCLTSWLLNDSSGFIDAMQSYSKNKHWRWVWASPASCVHAPLKAGEPSVGAGASLLLMAPTNPATGLGALQTHADQDPYGHPKKHLQRGNLFLRRDQTGTTSQLRSSQPHTWFLCSTCIDAVRREAQWVTDWAASLSWRDWLIAIREYCAFLSIQERQLTCLSLMKQDRKRCTSSISGGSP